MSSALGPLHRHGCRFNAWQYSNIITKFTAQQAMTRQLFLVATWSQTYTPGKNNRETPDAASDWGAPMATQTRGCKYNNKHVYNPEEPFVTKESCNLPYWNVAISLHRMQSLQERQDILVRHFFQVAAESYAKDGLKKWCSYAQHEVSLNGLKE